MPASDTYTETELLNQIAGNDEHAFRRFFEHYQQRVYTYALHFLKSEALAKEVLVDVFVNLWKKRDSLTVIEKLEAFLYITTRNLSFNLLKREALEGAARKIYSTRETPRMEYADDMLILREVSQALEKAVALLSPRQRKIYLLSRMDGLSHQEIACRLDISPNTVNVHITQALQCIRAHLAGHTGD